MESAGPGRGLVSSTWVDSMTDGVEDEAMLEERLERGTSVDRYVVLYELGAGGMGVVYAAYDPQLDRKVALKLLHASSRSDRARSRLLREAKAIARITHPHVVTVHDVGTYEGRVFVAMEYVEGLTLRRWLRQQQRGWTEILAVLRQAGEGLAAAHEGELVHRDFKPDNVLVSATGRAVVLDFGLARRTSSTEDFSRSSEEVDVPRRTTAQDGEPDLTRTGAKLGTPAYMAPEQHRSASTDERTDLFSFCVVAWEALYGKRPFAGATTQETREAVLYGEIVDPPSSDVPVAIRKVLERGLSTYPDDRYPDMESLLRVFAARPVRRRPWVIPAGLSVGMLGIVGIGMSVFSSYAPTQDAVCADAASSWNGVWDPSTRRAVERAFMASGAKFATSAWGTASETLDRYTTSWGRAHLDACEATRVRHQQTAETFELRTSCLDARHRAVEALVAEFVKADATVVESAVEAVNALPRIEECANVENLRVARSGRGDTKDSRRAGALREALVDARAKESSARYEDAQTIALRVLAQAQAIDADDIVAEARVALASQQQRRSEFADAERNFLEAVGAAQRSGHRLIEAEAWVRLVWVTGVERFDPERGHLWAEFARGAIERAGGVAALEAQLQHNLGGVLYTQGRYEEALAAYRFALARQLELLGSDDPAVATTHNHIGNVLMELGRFADAEVSCRAALAVRRELYGNEHPAVAAVLNNLGELERKREHPVRALAFAMDSLAVVGHRGGREEDTAALIAGWALLELGRSTESLVHFERSLAIRAMTDGPFAPRVVDVEILLAKARIALGESDVALAQLDRVIELEAGRRLDVFHVAKSLRASLLGPHSRNERDSSAAQTPGQTRGRAP